ncbi:phosphatase PAP2 family protein [Levilactobacillus bambusae]|uniref:Phospholipid phosphatase n=1 Tax=Levilactobacillus bambusae TaxID=2024736 RepID=A0A2V1N6P2_9LACO|nr:phosphatase PAP2 family protein [Levilactobacillus bambusae]PWG01090.1 phospholipid phosphatase [Levilactobacillus bambusae]
MPHPITRRRFWLTGLAAAVFLALLIGVSLQQPWVHQFDEMGIRLIRQPQNPMITKGMIDTSLSGNTVPTLVISILIAIILAVLHHPWSGAMIIFNVVVWAGSLNSLIKHLVRRPRPTVDRLLQESTYSFPSGHAITAMLLWGSLALVLGWLITTAWLRHTVQILCASWILLVGISRVFVGVHYPSDVLAGWCLGFVCLTLSQLIFGHLAELSYQK